MDKKILPKTEPSTVSYTLAKLVKSSLNSNKWYIEFSQGSADGLNRYRPTFDINRIESLRERKKNADDIIDHINDALGRSIPAATIIADIKKCSTKGRVKFAVDTKPLHKTPLKIAFNEIIQIKCNACKNSQKSYRHIATLFNPFIEKLGIGSTPVSTMLKRDAIGFLDFLETKGYCNTTYNNRLRDMKTVWNELIRREYTEVNPFNDIRYKKRSTKKRRNLTEHEKTAIATYCKTHEKWLFRAIILQYYLLIRPSEMARLRFNAFDFKKGTVYLSEDITKNGKPATLTIPSIALQYLLEDTEFTQYPSNFFVFGACFEPNPTKPISENYLNYKHRRVLEILVKLESLGDITGISFYSWKDSGITDLANDDEVSIFKASLHARHSETRTTMIYYHGSQIIPEIQRWRKRLM